MTTVTKMYGRGMQALASHACVSGGMLTVCRCVREGMWVRKQMQVDDADALEALRDAGYA